jgi:hypothetical protein
MASSVVQSFGPDDRINIMVVGHKSGSSGGRGGGTSQLLNISMGVTELLSKYGETPEEIVVDGDELTNLAATNPSAFQAALAKLAAKSGTFSSMSLEQRLVSAVKGVLEASDVILATTDPGVDKYWVNPEDITLHAMEIKGNGTQYIVSLSAPFGLS